MIIPSGEFTQICWVVHDLQQAMEHWLKTANVGPFFYLRSPPVGNFMYRGQPATLDMDVGLAQAGAMQIELIQPNGDSANAYRDAFAAGEHGLHHLGVLTGNYDTLFQRYIAMGFELAQNGLSGNARFSYFDTRSTLGHMVELIERDPSIEAMFTLIADAARDWNGSDPYREIQLSALDRHS